MDHANKFDHEAGPIVLPMLWLVKKSPLSLPRRLGGTGFVEASVIPMAVCKRRQKSPETAWREIERPVKHGGATCFSRDYACLRSLLISSVGLEGNMPFYTASIHRIRMSVTLPSIICTHNSLCGFYEGQQQDANDEQARCIPGKIPQIRHQQEHDRKRHARKSLHCHDADLIHDQGIDPELVDSNPDPTDGVRLASKNRRRDARAIVLPMCVRPKETPDRPGATLSKASGDLLAIFTCSCNLQDIVRASPPCNQT